MRKAIILDAGTIINFSINGLLDLFEKLKEIFKGDFLITEDVMYEVVKRPLNVKKFELSALRVRQLIKENTLKMPSYIGISNGEIEKRTKELLNVANRTFIARGNYIHLIDRGEASCLALSEILARKEINNVISVDERTLRMLCENPENLRKLMEKKLHTGLDTKKQNYQEFSKFRIIRSAELVYIAHKNRLVKVGNGMLLDALLYAVKYKGCSISKGEIEKMKRM